MAMDASEIERLIKARIPDAAVTIRDLAGDGDHYAATVLAESFRGKSRVQQHQIVYEALKGNGRQAARARPADRHARAVTLQSSREKVNGPGSWALGLRPVLRYI